MATQPKPAPKKPEPEDPHPAKMQPPPPAAAPPPIVDPQAAKFEAHAGPPTWVEPKAPKVLPEGTYADGMSVAEEQRARAADVEAHGDRATIDTRADADKPVLDKNALAGGGAFVKSGAQKQVPGVTVKPPTTRDDY